jgi:hypothetical protein
MGFSGSAGGGGAAARGGGGGARIAEEAAGLAAGAGVDLMTGVGAAAGADLPGRGCAAGLGLGRDAIVDGF